jgi:dTDP-4-amino-4,6-dideoxygalactose transaminase
LIVFSISPERANFNFISPAGHISFCLKNKDILAIIPVHLGGIPVNLESVLDIAKNNGIFIVEDCAQSLGAMNQGRKTGTIGDFAFYSLCRGKGITIYEGGAIITNSDSSGLIEETAKDIETLTNLKDKLRAYQILADQSKQSQEVQDKLGQFRF